MLIKFLGFEDCDLQNSSSPIGFNLVIARRFAFSCRQDFQEYLTSVTAFGLTRRFIGVHMRLMFCHLSGFVSQYTDTHRHSYRHSVKSDLTSR